MIGASLAGILASSFRQPWALTVQTTGVNQTWTVDINSGTSPAITIDWGDGSLNEYTTTGLKTHTYAAAGTYVAKLRGQFASGGNIRFGSDAGNRQRLKSTSAVPYIPGLLSFNATFSSCTGLTGSIPTDLFRYNTQVSTYGFNQTFYGCTGLTGSIPTDLFRYNTAVSTNGFYLTFYGCTGLTGSIPTDLFRYNTAVSTNGFYATFYGCTGLTSAPSLLFAYTPNCDSFQSVFQNCNKLQLPADLFSAAGDKSTRFLNKTVNFTNAMRIGTFTGTKGTAPDLWNYDFGSGTPTKTACFAGHTSSSVSNAADIPAEWK